LIYLAYTKVYIIFSYMGISVYAETLIKK